MPQALDGLLAVALDPPVEGGGGAQHPRRLVGLQRQGDSGMEKISMMRSCEQLFIFPFQLRLGVCFVE